MLSGHLKGMDRLPGWSPGVKGKGKGRGVRGRRGLVVLVYEGRKCGGRRGGEVKEKGA